MRTVVITLGHCTADLWRESCAAFYRMKSPFHNLEHFFVYHHWPIDKEKNKKELYNIANQYGLAWIDPGKNIGTHAAINLAFKEAGLTKEDSAIIYDSDSNPIMQGFDDALVSVVSDPRVGWACLKHCHKEEFADPSHFEKHEIKGFNVLRTKMPKMVSVSAMRMDFILEAGGFKGRTPLYGNIESDFWATLTRLNKWWVYLDDFEDDDRIKEKHINKDYVAWKFDYAHFKKIDYGFEEYLIEKERVKRPS